VAQGGQEVEAGTTIVREVGESFKVIIETVQNLTTQVQSVAAASEQVSSGVQNVAAASEEQTAAMEEVSAAAETLTGLSGELQDLANKFKV